MGNKIKNRLGKLIFLGLAIILAMFIGVDFISNEIGIISFKQEPWDVLFAVIGMVFIVLSFALAGNFNRILRSVGRIKERVYKDAFFVLGCLFLWAELIMFISPAEFSNVWILTLHGVSLLLLTIAYIRTKNSSLMAYIMFGIMFGFAIM